MGVTGRFGMLWPRGFDAAGVRSLVGVGMFRTVLRMKCDVLDLFGKFRRRRGKAARRQNDGGKKPKDHADMRTE